jgi:hypothetical protein
MSIGLVLSLVAGVVHPGDPVADWTEDVLHLVSELERLHPDPFFGCPREEFDAGIDEFLAGIERDGGQGATVGLMRLMARLSRKGRDGHAVVWPLQARALPLHLYRFDDGWFVVGAEPEQRGWIGARVVSVGGVPVEEACERLAPLLTRDNDWNLRLKLGASLACADLLAGVGLTRDPDRASFELSKDGASTVVELAAGGSMFQLWGRPDLPPCGGARWLEGHDWSWRLEVLEAERALYVQYNEIRSQAADGETLTHFAQELVRTFQERGLERVIVDVRSNGGGDNTTFGPLIAALKDPAFDRPGVLFGLIGRSTFSAAGNFATVLDRDTKAILVGEPTGGAPNQYGDARDVPLPHHPDVLVRIATRYHQFSSADDERLTNEPDLAVPLTSSDYFAGRDPVLRAALDYRPAR